jgi:hypothetical protein
MKLVIDVAQEGPRIVRERLAHALAPTLVLDSEGGEARNAYWLSVHQDADEVLRIALFSAGGGLPPKTHALSGRRVALGYDDRCCVVDVERADASPRIKLDGPFFEFLALGQPDEVVALHELGALRLRANGSVAWAVSAPDVVSGGRIDEWGRLVIDLMDSDAKMTVTVDAGCVVG